MKGEFFVDNFIPKQTIFTKKRIKLVEVSKWQNFHLKLKKNSWFVWGMTRRGWTKELNRVSFNGAPAKYDIRAWVRPYQDGQGDYPQQRGIPEVLVDAFKN